MSLGQYTVKPAAFSAERDSALSHLRTEAFSTDGWVKFDEKENVTYEKKTAAPGDSSPMPFVRGRGVVTGFNPDQFLALISCPELRSRWIGTTQEVKLFERYSQHEMCYHIAQKGVGFLVKPRDTFVVQDTIFNDDGTIERIQTSVSDDRIPPKSGRVRGNLTIAGWILKPHETGVEVTYVFKTNPGGSVPQTVTNTIVSQTPGAISRCADVLKKNGYPPYIASREVKSTILSEAFDYDPKPTYKITLIGKSGDSFDIHFDSKVFPKGPQLVAGDGKNGLSVSPPADGKVHVSIGEAASGKEVTITMK
ncbi:hypothetical protein FRB94_006634 [Tulasnella sp. JGI-2019a]|nr:hypothetical protein FRB94_006634 [Tulasnella sp. JGI-2019a]